ncbi:hypothetical protein AA21952_0749 [Acetobacter oeni LMG 21952]|nr:hypothetical protein AA21952_0749 [Acetobacter oeni LMG 21952]
MSGGCRTPDTCRNKYHIDIITWPYEAVGSAGRINRKRNTPHPWRKKSRKKPSLARTHNIVRPDLRTLWKTDTKQRPREIPALLAKHRADRSE